MTISDDRVRCIISNFRSSHSKAWNKRTLNWVAVRNLFGYGSGSASKLCQDLGIDPDGYTI